ncbi:Peptidyl-prolyl cis-trans isomerase FKBP65 [Striga hermonthica]|uniref:peptidylprolyl isomerase n=1 Tax=Striga hermonthica TaxID=68872 RepID=A0A9N7RF78_STRHE|nr:Peptidyl-prolyl cis-trans isomerase FKBP65 [Striga hermonthica]
MIVLFAELLLLAQRCLTRSISSRSNRFERISPICPNQITSPLGIFTVVPAISPEFTATAIAQDSSVQSSSLSKTILRKGFSWQTPIPGDEVEVRYSVGLQAGKYFDSNREKESPFRFKLGRGEVIKGWDEGIATMRKGERSIFTIPPELAYGEIGFCPLIPPNSTLIFDVELISWYPIRDISGDGGILKKIIVEGEGWATPSNDDEVLVKYVAKCENGKVISESNEGLEFSLTIGHLCPAMSRAVKTMRKGEKAEVFVKLNYGLLHRENGTQTVNGAFPQYQNLIIHLELVSWRTVVDVNGDKKILKKIMKKGEAFDRPNEGSIVKVVYVGKLEEGTIMEKRGCDEEPFEFVCGEEQVQGGLDKAVTTMRKGEEATVKISYDSLDLSKVGGLSTSNALFYEIKLIDFTKEKPFWKMDAQERINACQAKKNYGNILFKAGKFLLASKKYDKECDLGMKKEIDDEKAQAKSLRLSCYLNEAACKLKLEEYQEVSRLCTTVLDLDPNNVKALFRRSQAYMRTSDLEKAEGDINQALLLDPNNREVKIKCKELKEKQRQYAEHEAKMFSTMISRIG